MAFQFRYYVTLITFAFFLTVFRGTTSSSRIDTCEGICSSTFQEYEQTACFRGCRFMVLIDFVNGAAAGLKDIRGSCLEACQHAYGSTNVSACAFGCQSQLPMIDVKRKEMESMSSSLYGGGDLFDFSSRFHDYARRMMDCMMDQISHQMNHGWMIISSSGQMENSGRRIVVIRGSPVYRGALVESQNNEDDVRTSDFVKTGALPVDEGGATPDCLRGGSQIISAHSVSGVLLREDVPPPSASSSPWHRRDWLGCLSRKTGLSRLSIVMLMFVMLIVFVWFVVGIVFPAGGKSEAPREKLSVYGDSEYLMPLDEKSPVVFAGLKKYPEINVVEAPPLPIKSELI